MSLIDMSSRETPRILCTGIIVLDQVFRVEQFPQPALALAEGRSEVVAMRFGAAVAAGIKCCRRGGSAGSPTRAEVEAFLMRR
jgi:hypothetical protein